MTLILRMTKADIENLHINLNIWTGEFFGLVIYDAVWYIVWPYTCTPWMDLRFHSSYYIDSYVYILFVTAYWQED